MMPVCRRAGDVILSAVHEWSQPRYNSCKMMMQMPSNSFLGHPALQSNYQSMMIGAAEPPQRLLPTWNYPPPPPPPPPTHTTASAGSTSVFNCLPIDRPSSNDDKSIQGHTQQHQHQQQHLASSTSSSSMPPFTGYCQKTFFRGFFVFVVKHVLSFIPHVWKSRRWKHWSVRQIKPAQLAFGRTLI